MTNPHMPPPATWPEAFARLPLVSPPAGGWDAIAHRLPRATPRPRRWPLWTALAASLLLAVALPVRWLAPDAPAPSAPASDVATLQNESARLEALLPLLADDRVATGTAALMSGELELRLAEIDAGLRDPALDPQARERLWRSRVDTLLALVQFEGERSWLAAQGSRFDTALVQID
ncbi:hypothetical protein E4582_10985 [Luteimonas yindakuii]|uniref:Uncharacterized protein n=1 Tax=Luteimonas yindakuii TaxID=2565782 RepID=A0A4Z1RGE6_9GAMM|nr:hypothetical protein [Luteimonas yindakuii]TKS52761.1 hypothetical protein E4582_10985 [Luteimonas yindakuii]